MKFSEVSAPASAAPAANPSTDPAIEPTSIGPTKPTLSAIIPATSPPTYPPCSERAEKAYTLGCSRVSGLVPQMNETSGKSGAISEIELP